MAKPNAKKAAKDKASEEIQQALASSKEANEEVQVIAPPNVSSIKEFLAQNPISQVFQKPKKSVPKIHGKVGHYQADLTFLTRYQKQNTQRHQC